MQSAEKGAQLFEDLRKFSFDTTFGVDELASASSQLLNAGMAVNQLQDNLKRLGDLAQGDKSKFQELTSIFAKVQNTGKATSMQLQQIALRGIPIQKTLKEMGVVGTASAEQLTKAFEKLTAEGGQFHNAMDNIIDTIEGKRGFIEDTLKEINVNFGELTGLTDAYKSGMDLLYNILNHVNESMMAINDNPFLQAVLRGVILGALTAIAGVIAVSIIPKLIQVIAQLTTINMLAGPAGWAVLAVAGITAVATAMVTYKNKTEEATEEQKKLAKAIEDTKKMEAMDYNYRANGLTPASGSRNADLEAKMSTLRSYQNVVKDYEEQLTEARVAEEYFLNEKKKGRFGLMEEEGLANARAEIEKIEAYKKSAEGLVESQKKLVDEVQGKVDRVNALEPMKQTFEELAENTLPKDRQELSEIESQLKSIVNYETELNQLKAWQNNEGSSVVMNDERYQTEKEYIDKIKDYYQKKLNEVKLKIRIDEEAKDWQKKLQEVLGFDNETMGKLMDKTLAQGAGTLVKDYASQLSKIYEQRLKTDVAMGINGTTGQQGYLLEQAKDLMSVYDKLMESGLFGVGENGLDNTTQTIKDLLDNLRAQYKDAGGDLEAFDNALGNATEELKKLSWKELIEKALSEAEKSGILSGVAKYTAQGTIYSSLSGTDVGMFLDKLEETGQPLVALIEVIITDLIQLIGGMNKLQYLFNIIKNVLEALSPVLEFVVNIVSFIGWVLKPILDALKWALNWIFGDFNKACDELFNAMDEETLKRKESTKDLTSEYQKLKDAIKEQEEYYIRKKAELNMVAMRDEVTKVNDMILTPNGTFSTSPQDTIIATKNPQGLGGGVVNNIKVINNAGAQVDVQEHKGNGINDIIVTISKKIANDVANGYNGWDGAFAMQKQRVEGRRI